MSSLAATFQEGFLERRFRFAAHGTTLARDTMAGVTTFIVMSYIIFLNPIILTSVKPKVGAALPFRMAIQPVMDRVVQKGLKAALETAREEDAPLTTPQDPAP